MKITQDAHRLYLLRTARDLSTRSGRQITPAQVLGALLDLAIRDEAIYDPTDGRPLSASRREIVQEAREARTTSLVLEELLDQDSQY